MTLHSANKSVELPPPSKVIDILYTLSQYGNPPDEDNPITASIIDVGTADYLNFFETEILNDFILHGGSTIKIFQGVAGSGKTHILQLLQRLALNKGFLICKVDLSRDLSFTDSDLVTKTFLQDCYIQIDGKIYHHLPDILSFIGKNYDIDLEKYKKNQLEHPCFQNAMEYAIRNNLDSDAWMVLRQYLMGETVTVAQLKRNGLKRVKKPLKENNAEQVFSTVLNSIPYFKIPGTIIFFDENDREWLSEDSRKSKLAANTLRRLIDSFSLGRINGAMGIFAVSENFIRACNDRYIALGSRLESFHKDSNSIAWRWFILEVQMVNHIFNEKDNKNRRELFLRKSIQKFTMLVEYCGGNINNLSEELELEGLKELLKTNNENYKRSIIKLLASISYKRLE